MSTLLSQFEKPCYTSYVLPLKKKNFFGLVSCSPPFPAYNKLTLTCRGVEQ